MQNDTKLTVKIGAKPRTGILAPLFIGQQTNSALHAEGGEGALSPLWTEAGVVAAALILSKSEVETLRCTNSCLCNYSDSSEGVLLG